MRKLTKLLSALIVLVLATAFIGCGNPSSSDNGGGNSNSPTYTTVAGGTYLHSASSQANGWAFNADNSVNRISSGHSEKKDGWKWRISGYTVEMYNESTSEVLYTFTANSGFTQLTNTSHGSGVYNRQ